MSTKGQCQKNLIFFLFAKEFQISSTFTRIRQQKELTFYIGRNLKKKEKRESRQLFLAFIFKCISALDVSVPMLPDYQLTFGCWP
jgi:hypothetical protein